METIVGDLRLAVRRLVRSPGFSLVAIGCLAVGLGLTSAVYGIVDAVLLRSLPYESPDRLVLIQSHFFRRNLEGLPASGREYLDYRERASAFEDLAVVGVRSLDLTGRGEPERLVAGRASASLFPLLGVEPEIGRAFSEQEDVYGKNDVVLLSHRLWATRFGADPDIVGGKLLLDDHPYTVVGVLPEDFWFLSKGFDLWIPMAMNLSNLPPRNARGPTVVARLRDGVTLEQARLDMDRVARSMQREHPDSYPEDSGWGLDLVPVREAVLGDVRGTLWTLFGTVGLILVLAVANVANMMLARAAGYEKEVGIRMALGAGRGRLVRQFLTEGLLLALLAGGLGLLLAHWTTGAAIAIDPGRIPRLDEVALGPRVICFTALLAALVGGVFGLIPALGGFRRSFAGVLKEGGRAGSVGAKSGRVRSALVVAQVAVACTVLVGAALIVESLHRLDRADPGFRTAGVLTFRVYLGPAGYPRPADRAQLVDRMIERLKAVPGVESAGAVSHLPLGLMDLVAEVKVADDRATPGGSTTATGWRMVSPGYFGTMDIPVLSGRGFRASDRDGAAGVVVLDHDLAQRLFPDRNPVGERLALLRFDGSEDWRRVVGVVGHVDQGGVTSESGDQLYVPYDQYPFQVVSLAMHTGVDPTALTDEVRRAAGEVAPDLPLLDLVPMEEYRRQSLSAQRLNALLFALFAGVALVLSAAGVYGVMAYSVARRTRELGVRVALGADRRGLLWLVMRRAALLAAAGLAAGLVGAWLLSRAIASQLYGVGGSAGWTFAAVGAFLLGVALVASLVPSLKAARTDPVVALRSE